MAARAIKAGAAYVGIYSDSTQLERGLKMAEAKVKRFGGSISAIGGKMATLGASTAAAFGGAVGAIGTVFAGFDEKMAAVQAVSGAAGKDLDTLREKAKELGAATKFSASEAAEAMKFLGMAGMDAQQIYSAVTPVLNVAAAGMLDLGRAADIVSDATTAFGLSAEQTGRVADVMAKTATSSNTSIEQMGEAFVYAAAQGKAAGQTVEDISAAIGVLGNSGLKASIAGSGLQGIFKRFVSPKVGKHFKALGVEMADVTGKVKPLTQLIDELAAATQHMTQVERLKKFEQLFGLHSKTAVVLVDNADALRKMTHDLQGAQGAAAKMAGVMSQSLMGAWQSFKSSIEGVTLALGEALNGPMTGALAIGTALARSVIKVVDANRGFVTGIGAAAIGIAALGGAAAVAGTGLIVLGATISAVGTVIGAVGSMAAAISGAVAAIGAPIIGVALGVTAAVVGIGAAFIYVANQAGLVAPAFEFLKQSFGRVYEVFNAAFGGILKALQGGQMQLAAEIAWAGVQVATLKGTQQALKAIDYLWKNAMVLSATFFDRLLRTTGEVFKQLPQIAFNAIRGGASISQAINRALANAFTQDINLAASLDPAIDRAQQRFRAKLGQANRIGAVGAAPRGNPNQALRPQGARAMSIPPQQLTRATAFQVPAAPSVAAAVNASARPPQAAGAGAGAMPGMAELVGLNRQQVIVLRQILDEGLA